MFERIMAWLTERPEGGDLPGATGSDTPGSRGGRRDALQLAVAALMVEAANVDEHFEESERAAIRRLLQRCFGLSTEQARALEAAAEQQAERSTQLFGFTRTINARWSPDQRAELIEMLWEVAYADGALDPLEDTMLRRVGGLIDVADRQRGEARLRVLRRLGLAEPG
jgi:uncharacterized tellurite resistance protein B-like protein